MQTPPTSYDYEVVLGANRRLEVHVGEHVLLEGGAWIDIQIRAKPTVLNSIVYASKSSSGLPVTVCWVGFNSNLL